MTQPLKAEDAPARETFAADQPLDIFLLARLGFTVVFVVVTALIAEPYLESLTWALVLAVVFIRPHRWLEAWLGPTAAATLSVLLIAVIVVAPILFVSQRLVNEALIGLDYIQNAIAEGKWSGFLDVHPWFRWLGKQIDLREILARLGQLLTVVGATLLRQSTGQALSILLSFYMLFFFLRDRRAGLEAIVRYSPFSGIETGKLLVRARDTIHAIIYGTLAVAALQGALGGFMFWVLNFPSALFWALLMGVLSIIPVLGSFVVWIPATIFLALEDRWGEALALGIWGSVVISTADNLVRPLLVGETLRMHTASTFVAMLGGLQLFGASGLILGPIALTSTTLMLEFWRRRLDPDLQTK
ncbi:MAG: AI-2E family transporter [Methylocystis sp.]